MNPVISRTPRALARLLAPGALALMLAACSGGDATPPPPESTPEGAISSTAVVGDPPAETAGAQEPAGDAPPPATTGETAAAPTPLPEGDLVVFAASSLTDAFDALARAFEAQNGGITVVLNTAASSQLAVQINEGAPADVFASANEQQMGQAVLLGRMAGPTVSFATNQPAIIVPADNPANIESIEDLAEPGVRLVLAAPGVPIRDYANQVFEQMAVKPEYGLEFLDRLSANIVSEEDNVRQVAAKVALGEADAGVVYVTDITPEIADQVSQIAIPDEYHVTASYPVGVVADAPHAERARAFVDFLLSTEGQSILAQHGFGPAPGD